MSQDFFEDLILGGAEAALAPQEQPSYEQDPAYREKAWEWSQMFGEQYPEFPGLPEQVGEMGTALSQMLGGELSPAVQKYLTNKYQQAWTSALPYYADIGAGPGTLASQRIQLGQQQAIQGAYMGQQQIAKGMEFMPSYTTMMMSPYMADVVEWQNLANLGLQTYPGQYTAPGDTTTTPSPTGIQYEGGRYKEWLTPTGKPSGRDYGGIRFPMSGTY